MPYQPFKTPFGGHTLAGDVLSGDSEAQAATIRLNNPAPASGIESYCRSEVSITSDTSSKAARSARIPEAATAAIASG